MDSFLISSILLFFMFTGGQSASYSQSCSMVNGVQTCTSDQSSGNVAMSSSQAGTGGSRGSYSSNVAGTGNTGTGTFNSVGMSSGNPPPGGVFMPLPMPGFGMPGGGAFAGAGAFAGNGGAFAGNLPFNPFAMFGRR